MGRVRYSRALVSAMLDLREGAIFAQQFKVLRPLAKGGMGAVYVVEQLGTKRERALKLMHPMLVSDERSRDRFEREAQVSARIDSDHVVEVIAAGVETATGTPWLCMELLRGEELAQRMQRGPLSAAENLEVFKQLGHALGAAHRAGIVHRDLKPENLFLATPRREGIPFTLKVLDFGVAALVHEASGKSTATQGVGSPLWMAPEQTNVGNVQPATDVWAVGLLAYHFLTGAFYWKSASTEGSTLTALLVEVMVEPLAPPSVRAREQGRDGVLPRGFDAWFARCVARDPKDRFGEAGAAIAELVAVLTGQTPSLAPGTAPQAFAATMAAPTAPLGGVTGPPAPSFPATGAGVSPPTAPMTAPAALATATPPAMATATPPATLAAAPAPRAIWPWVIGSALLALLLCGGGIGYVVVQGARAVAEVAAAPRLDVTGEHGEHVEISSAGVVVTMPDAGAVVVEADAGAPDAGEPTEEVVAAVDPVPPAAHAGPDENTSPDAPRRRTGAGRGGSTSPTARMLRARLDRCVTGNIAGEPRARWTFTLRFNRFGMAEGARIEGPRPGDREGRYMVFRRCVQMDVAGFDSGGDPGPFTLMLP
jgi:eukaryotic-like serine/threonine-protein kinase